MAQEQKLERTLGLLPALAIGVGTMIGAGIFIFPGLAAGQAGTGAWLAFVIAGTAAFLVAMCTAELATAMPESGGVYFFVTQASDRRLGLVVGLSQWLGLIFASSFYLVGFVKYVDKILIEFGFGALNTNWWVAGIATLLLLGINVAGANWFGRAQNGIVGSLLVLLVVFVSTGLLRMAGLVEPTIQSAEWLSKGWAPTFNAAALVFTSFLGFVQIATVGGEIKKPSKNLPRSLLGSVAAVTAVYATTLFVATTVVTPQVMAEQGETAMVEVGRELWGRIGVAAILCAGLLATVSSANASILSASRAIFALSKDELAPQSLSQISSRYGSPHWALLATGIPVAILTIFGRVTLLAEVASCMHLFLYTLIAIVLIRLRTREPDWYTPKFRVLGYPILPAISGLTSAGLIALMSKASIITVIGILIATALLSLVVKRRKATDE